MNDIGLPLKQLLNDVEMLSKAQVVSGFDGLDRLVQWPQIADIPGMTDWLRNGELLLTTSFALQEPAAQQRALINALVEKGVAGMVVAVGRYFKHTSPAVRAAADAVDFPIVELPWQIPLLETAKQISQRIIAQQTELLNHSIKIHQTLTQLALQNSDLEALAQALAQLLKRPVIIEDINLISLAYANLAQEKGLRQLSLHQLKTPRSLINHLQNSGILAELQRSPRPIRMDAMPTRDEKTERIIAPVMAGKELLGYVWVIADKRPLIHLDYIAIEHAATVIALIITRERAVQQATRQRYGDLFDHLLTEGVVLTDRLLTEARQLGLDPYRPYRVLLVRGSNIPSEEMERIEAALRQAFHQVQKQALLTNKRDDLVMILEEIDIPIAREILTQLYQENNALFAGLSNSYDSLVHLHRSYQEALEATEIWSTLQLDTPIVEFHTLGFLHWLYLLPERWRTENSYVAKIQVLADYDTKYRSKFLHTLEIYLDQGANASAAAKSLHLHRSTLLYRLEKCQTLCQADLSSPQERLNLLVALKAWRIHSYKV